METSQNVQDSVENGINIIPKNFGDIIQILAKHPEIRRDMVKWIQAEWGFNIENYLEDYFGRMPDKITKLDELEAPERELLEDIVGYIEDDGYSIGQTARIMGLSRTTVKKLWDNRESMQAAAEKAAAKAAKKARDMILKTMPWYARYGVKLGIVKI